MNVRPDVKTCLRIHVARVLPKIANLVRAANRMIVDGLSALCHRSWLCDLPLDLQLLLRAEDRVKGHRRIFTRIKQSPVAGVSQNTCREILKSEGGIV